MSKNNIRRAQYIILLIFFVSVALFPLCASADIVKGTISVRSAPQGADIYLNDENIGEKTNYVILDVFPGIHFIRLEMPGYKTWEEIIEVKEGEITFVSHDMEISAGDAFTIQTKPEGARIYVDGEFEGFSNTVLNQLPTGQHTFLLTLDNYSDYQKTVMINEGMSQSLMHTFEPLPVTGEVIFESNPSNAAIYLNGEYIGDTRYTLKDVSPGTYDVVIKKAGYDDWKGILDVAAGKISEVKASLSLSKAEVVVKTEPPDADVFLDGELIGKSPVSTLTDQGSHTIRIEKFGYRPVEEIIEVGPLGTIVSYTLYSMAKEAVDEAESAINANLQYNPEKGKELLISAKEALERDDTLTTITLSELSITASFDVDSDGVLNSQDIAPNLNNTLIYLSPFAFLIVFVFLFAADYSVQQIRPELLIDIPKKIFEDDMLARGHVTARLERGPYRAFVCTIYIDDSSVDHFTNPGRYDIMLAGRGVGEHILSAHLQIAKKRYGSLEIKAEEKFIVESLNQKKDDDFYSDTKIRDFDESSKKDLTGDNKDKESEIIENEDITSDMADNNKSSENIEDKTSENNDKVLDNKENTDKESPDTENSHKEPLNNEDKETGDKPVEFLDPDDYLSEKVSEIIDTEDYSNELENYYEK